MFAWFVEVYDFLGLWGWILEWFGGGRLVNANFVAAVSSSPFVHLPFPSAPTLPLGIFHIRLPGLWAAFSMYRPGHIEFLVQAGRVASVCRQQLLLPVPSSQQLQSPCPTPHQAPRPFLQDIRSPDHLQRLKPPLPQSNR